MSVPIEVVQKRAAAIREQWDTRRKYRHTEETDAVIRRAWHLFYEYANKKAVAAAAKQLGWPKHALTQRAKNLGLARVKEKPWTPAEEELLERWAWMSDPRIAGKFRQSGFHRTETAIHLKAKRLKLKSTLDGWGMRQLAKLFGVDDHKISVWSRRGMLKTHRTGITVGQNEKLFIHRDEVRRFILNHPDEVDLAKCEKFWLLDIVSGGKLCEEFRKEAAA